MTTLERLDKRLDEVLGVLKAKYHPEKIILYGSLARGKVRRWSDIDLVVIKRTRERFLRRLVEADRIADPELHGGLDILVYTPTEVKRMMADRPSYFREEILKKGRVLYTRR